MNKRDPLSELKNLEHEHDLLSAILDVARLLVVVLDPEGRIVFFNRPCEEATGYTLEEVKGSLVCKLLAPEETEDVKEVLQALRNGHFPNEHENAWVAKDGTLRRFHWANTALFGEDGTIQYLVGTGIDVTDRFRAQEELKELAHFNQTILDTAVDGIIAIDEHGTVESFNRAAEGLFGYSAKEVIGRNVSTLMPSPYREQHDEYLQRYRATGERRIIGIGREVLGQHKDGTIFPLGLSVGEINTPGKKRLFTGIVHDLGYIKQVEEEARRRLAEMAHTDRVQSMGDLASGVAHEVNQPLSAIVNYAQAGQRMLQAGSAPTETLANALEQIADQAQRADNIIRHLRQFVDKGELEHTRIDLNETVQEVLHLLIHEINARKAQVRTELDRGLPEVMVDRVQIEQVLFNLVRNALEALETLPVENRVLTLETAYRPKEVEVTVADNGPGLPKGEAERVFDSFFTTKPKGMGQGLSICRSLIEAHGGRLEAASNNPQGARFRFTLPLGPAPEDSAIA